MSSVVNVLPHLFPFRPLLCVFLVDHTDCHAQPWTQRLVGTTCARSGSRRGHGGGGLQRHMIRANCPLPLQQHDGSSLHHLPGSTHHRALRQREDWRKWPSPPPGLPLDRLVSPACREHAEWLLTSATYDRLAHFDRERIPERVVHAKGSGAHGVLEVRQGRLPPVVPRSRCVPDHARHQRHLHGRPLLQGRHQDLSDRSFLDCRWRVWIRRHGKGPPWFLCQAQD